MAKKRGLFSGLFNHDQGYAGGSGDESESPLASLFGGRLPLSPDTTMNDFMNTDFGRVQVMGGGQIDADDIRGILDMLFSGFQRDTRPTDGAYVEDWIQDAFASEDNPRIYAEIRRLWEYIEIDDPMALWILENKMLLVHQISLADGGTLELWDFGCIMSIVWKGADKWYPVHSVRWMSMLLNLHIMDIMSMIGYWDDALFNQLYVEYNGFDLEGSPEAAAELRRVIDFDAVKNAPINTEHILRAVPFLDIEDARGITPWDFYEAVEEGILEWNRYARTFERMGFVRFWEELAQFDPFLNAYAAQHGLSRRRKMIIRHIALSLLTDYLKDNDASPAVNAVVIVIISTYVYEKGEDDLKIALQHGDMAAEFAALYYGVDVTEIRRTMQSVLMPFIMSVMGRR